jgi:hypothetical protein
LTGSSSSTGPIGPTSDLSGITALKEKTQALSISNVSTMNINSDFEVKGNIVVVDDNPLVQYFPLTYPLVGVTFNGPNMSCSGTGQYVFICGDKAIYTSQDYGINFTLNTFASTIYAIAISADGKYGCAVSTGSPQANILLSDDFGVTWVEDWVPGTSTSFYSSVAVSKTGKYMYLTGGGTSGKANAFSSNYGVAFVAHGASNICTGSGMDVNGRVMIITILGAISFVDILVPSNPVATDSLALSSNNFNTVSCNPDGEGYVATGGSKLLYNPTLQSNVGVPITTPVNFNQIRYLTGGIMFARASTSVYKSVDLGITWEMIYDNSVLTRQIALSNNGNYLYILLQDGNFLVKNLMKYVYPTRIGYTEKFFLAGISNYSNVNTNIRLGDIPVVLKPGIWSVKYGFKMGLTTTTGTFTNHKVRFSLSNFSGSVIDDAYAVNIEPYSISTSTSSWQTFTEHVIIASPHVFGISMNSKLLVPAGVSSTALTSAYAYDTFITAIFIKQL